jgi:glycosyltransferase involved in cell wall biosynthesis
MRRLLVVMSQPPGCSGVQALIYNKLLPFFEQHGWEVHFAGPAPWLSSVLTEALDYPPERLHYTTHLSASRQWSVRKNRHRKGSPLHLACGVLQLAARLLERLTRHDGEAYLLRGLKQTVEAAEARAPFDLLAGKSPDFQVLALAHRLSQEMDKPFLALMDDPYGARDANGFHPRSPEQQQAILGRARGTLFMSPLTRDRYVAAGLVQASKAHVISDSYPVAEDLYRPGRSTLARHGSPTRADDPLRMVYLGMLPEWRPIEPLLEALSTLRPPGADQPAMVRLTIHGFVYDDARRRIAADPRLAAMIQIQPLVSYAASHALAADADAQLVVIGPRHLDNVPSKFFEYLGHHKPMLILGPPQNPLRAIVDDLGIGVYVDGRDREAILDALRQIHSHRTSLRQAYSERASAIEAFSAPRVARRFCALLDQAMEAPSA